MKAMQKSGGLLLSRRRLIATAAAGVFALTPRIKGAWAQSVSAASDETAEALFRALDERIEAAMKRYHVPGVAVAVYW